MRVFPIINILNPESDCKMNKIDYLQAIRSRHSVRAFTDAMIDEYRIEALNQAIAHANAEGAVHLQLVLNEPHAFGDSRLAHYGKFGNVRNYISVVGPDTAQGEETAGYYGEEIVLIAQALGLNTCWVGLSYKKSKVQANIAEGEKLYALIAIGFGITNGISHKIKRPEQVANRYGLQQAWFANAVDMALLAPTALNQQKFKFELLPDGTVKASKGWGPYTRLDLGIVKRHFVIGAGAQPFEWNI